MHNGSWEPVPLPKHETQPPHDGELRLSFPRCQQQILSGMVKAKSFFEELVGVDPGPETLQDQGEIDGRLVPVPAIVASLIYIR